MRIPANCLLASLTVIACGSDDAGGSGSTGTAAPTEASTSAMGSSSSGGTATATTTTPDPTSETPETSSTEASTGTPSDDIPMFVALGQGGRRMVSCDDGQTWGAEHVIEMNDDDHGPYSSRDVAWGDGTFLLGMGWGNPARISRSIDGIEWEETFPPPDYVEMRGLSAISHGAGRFVAVVGRDAWASDDAGQTWSLAGQLPTNGNIRVMTYGTGGSGGFFAVEDGGLIYRSVDGVDWTDPLTTQGSCDGGNLSRQGGVADRDGVLVLVTDIGNVCRSDDGGATFTHHTVDTVTGSVLVRSDVVATDDGFFAAGRDVGWHSADGASWQGIPFTLEGDDIATLAHSTDSGTLIGIAWNGDDFYRSTDSGRTWDRADAPPGNDTNQAEFGYATPSSACP